MHSRVCLGNDSPNLTHLMRARVVDGKKIWICKYCGETQELYLDQTGHTAQTTP
jgi:hypothetical protein